jgi:hypothetical protein
MGRPKGSKNKKNCCTTLSHCLQDAVATQDAAHLESQNANVLAVINDNDTESESEYESEFDDSITDKDYEPPCDTEQDMPSSVQAAPSTVIEPPRTQNPTTSKKSESRSTHVTTLKVSTTKSGGGGGRVKKPTDVAALMTKNLEYFKRALEQRQNNQFELANENIHGLAERIQLLSDKCERGSNHMLKLIAKIHTTLIGMDNFTKYNTPLAIKKVSDQHKFN